MDEQSTKQTYQTLYLILAILAIVSCLPFFFFPNMAVALVVLGISIYLMVKVPKENKRQRGALFLVIASGLEIVYLLLLVVALGSLVKSIGSLPEEIKDLPVDKLAKMGGIALVAMLFALASWVVRIIGTVFAFINYSHEKQIAFENKQAQ